MPYCPKCRYEFRDNIKVCPDCNSELVELLPDDAPDIDVKWVLLGKLSSVVEAEMLREMLANEKISALIKSDLFHSLLATQGTGMAGSFAKVYVAEDQLAKARDIYRAMSEDNSSDG